MTAATLTFNSPLGPITVTESNGTIAAIAFAALPGATRSTPLLDGARQQLTEYFARTRTHFDLPLAPPLSPFQARIRAAMLAIPHGETRSYGDLAAALRSAPRAVGRACGSNPIPILVPCHRVLTAGGGIGGYSAGGGVATKRWLLAHEARASSPGDLFAHGR